MWVTRILWVRVESRVGEDRVSGRACPFTNSWFMGGPAQIAEREVGELLDFVLAKQHDCLSH